MNPFLSTENNCDVCGKYSDMLVKVNDHKVCSEECSKKLQEHTLSIVQYECLEVLDYDIEDALLDEDE